jgi:hypothetical protein
LHRLDDVVIPGAPTEITFESGTYLVDRGIGIAVEQANRGHDHTWSAVSTLETVFLPERVLHGVKLAVVRETLDRLYRASIRLDSKHGARLHGLTIHEHGTGAATGCIAADM